MLLALNGSTHISYIVRVDTLAVLRWSEMAKVRICNPRKPVFSRKEDSHSRNFDAALIVHLLPASFSSPPLLLCATWRLCCGKISQNRDKNYVRPLALAPLFVLAKSETGASEKRRQWREDLFTATDSDLDGDGLRSSHCRIFPRPRRNVT